jgi:hypothetical protein
MISSVCSVGPVFVCTFPLQVEHCLPVLWRVGLNALSGKSPIPQMI